MKTFSPALLAQMVTELRKKKGLTQEQLGAQTLLNRVMVGRIERENFIPSVVQLQALSAVLGFDLAQIFVEQEEEPSDLALHRESLDEEDRDGFDRLLSMMLALRQQLMLRKAYEHEPDVTELARERRRALGYSAEAPIAKDLVFVLERLGITRVELPVAGSTFSAMLHYCGSLPFMAVNTSDYYDRQILAIARQLYHYYTKTGFGQQWPEGNGDDETRAKADRFAAEFLLPEEVLKRRIAGEFGVSSLEGVAQQALLRFIARLHCTWHLPYRSIVNRLCDSGVIDTEQYQALNDIDERDRDGEYWRLGKALNSESFIKLNTRTETTGTSAYAIASIVRNFEEDVIDEQEFAETLRLFGKDPADFGYAITIAQEDRDEIEEFISSGERGS